VGESGKQVSRRKPFDAGFDGMDAGALFGANLSISMNAKIAYHLLLFS
jgi:hypothetical protein